MNRGGKERVGEIVCPQYYRARVGKATRSRPRVITSAQGAQCHTPSHPTCFLLLNIGDCIRACYKKRLRLGQGQGQEALKAGRLQEAREQEPQERQERVQRSPQTS